MNDRRQRFYVFAYDFHEEWGGILDKQLTCDTFEQAEAALWTLPAEDAPYDYWEGAQIVTTDAEGDLVLVARYWNRGRLNAPDWHKQTEPGKWVQLTP